MSLANDLSKMARDGGVTTPKLADNAFSTDKLFQIGQGQFVGRNNTQTGTGNVGATQSYPDISLTSALSAPYNATTAWRSLSAYLNQVKNTNSNMSILSTGSPISQIFSGPSLTTGGQGWEGGCLAPNGKIYCFPEQGNNFLKIDPDTGTITTFGSIGATASYQGCTLASNGRIYGAPSGTSLLRVLDPSNDTITVFATLQRGTYSGTDYIQGGVLAPNGKIYLIPKESSVFYFIDPDANTVSAFASFVGNPTGNYARGCLAPNGNIYMTNAGSIGCTLVRVIDPSSNTISVIATSTGGVGILGCAPDGNLYGTPTGGYFTVINPTNNTITTYSTNVVAGNPSPSGACMAPNGKMYFNSWNGTFFGVLDPETKTVIQLGTVGALQFLSPVYHPSGKIILTPGTSTQVVAYNLKLNNNWNLNFAMSPFFNKN